MSLAPRDLVWVFFDGQCASCHFVVRFLLRRQKRHHFRFLPLSLLQNTPLEGAIREQYDLDLDSSLVVWKNGELKVKAAAVFAILAELGWPWNLLLLLRVVPLFICDIFYDLYAKNRYRIAGKAKNPDLCAMLPVAQRRLFPAAFPDKATTFRRRAAVFATAQWQHLLMINFAVPADVLLPYLPHGVELDSWDGKTLVSLVAFTFTRMSLDGMTLPMASDFEEVNLRFYVKRMEAARNGEAATLKRGVVFIKEIVPSRLIATTANLLYGEHYVALPTNSHLDVKEGTTEVSYSWREGDNLSTLSAKAHGEPQELKRNSLAEFITEHYFGYTKTAKANYALEYEVEHPPWRVWENIDYKLEGNYLASYPPEISRHMKAVHSAFLAEGSVVRIIGKKPIR